MAGKLTFTIRSEDGVSFSCNDGESVLAAMRRQSCEALAVGCRSGGCGVCRIRISDGTYRLGPVGRNHVSVADQALGFALACRVYPETDLKITAAPLPAYKAMHA